MMPQQMTDADPRVLLVDDVSGSGDTFDAALVHPQARGRPADLRTAVLHHKVWFTCAPDFFAQHVVKWR
jgi:hypoxanthine phosphoribosyltransferase